MLLLSMLHRVPLSGYDIATLLKEPIPLVWSVKHSQIYPALADLEGGGDIAGDWTEQRGRPSKKSYRLTQQGRNRLVEWLLQLRGPLRQEEAILIAYNYKLVGAEVAMSALRLYRRQAETEMSGLEARWRDVSPDFQESGGPLGPRAAFEFSLMALRGEISWCDWFVAQIAADPAAEAGTAGARLVAAS